MQSSGSFPVMLMIGAGQHCQSGVLYVMCVCATFIEGSDALSQIFTVGIKKD